ncbi:MAG TPA: GntR family transcriptional regulator [Opitutus sp.]|nr:GntR family transcriptional regulator [Opitutus sp.]
MSRTITPQRMRDEARALLRSMIVEGGLAPATHIEEVKLSQQIGASRTPVREALIALEGEGLVQSAPRKGFVVVEPNAALVRESFPILSALEGMAVRISGAALKTAAPQLRRINEALARERKKARQYDLDRAFHVALTKHCGNRRLLMLLEAERARAQLIDGAHQKGMANLKGSVEEHNEIIAALERGNADGAALVLARHWDNGINVVVKWLSEKS